MEPVCTDSEPGAGRPLCAFCNRPFCLACYPKGCPRADCKAWGHRFSTQLDYSNWLASNLEDAHIAIELDFTRSRSLF